MSGINKVILIGRLGKEPETQETSKGLGCKFSLATSDSWTDKQGQKQEKTEWHNIVIWGRLAEVAAQYLHKGDKVYLEGKLETTKFNEKYYTRVVLNAFGSKLEMLDSKNSQNQVVPAPEPPRTPHTESQPSITPVEKDDFEDEIPF
jgi:single-strand DNA-binding protein